MPLGSALCYSISSLLVKKISLNDSTHVSVFYLLGGMTLLSSPFAYAQWQTLSFIDTSKIMVLSFLYAAIQALLIYAYAHAHAGFLAPFKFVRFPVAVGVGFFYFGESISLSLIVGGFLIALGCFLTRYVESIPSFLLMRNHCIK